MIRSVSYRALSVIRQPVRCRAMHSISTRIPSINKLTHVNRPVSHSFVRRWFSSSSIYDVNGIPTIHVKDAKNDMDSFDRIIDVRELDEVAHGMIEGAEHFPMGQALREVNEESVQSMKGQKVLVYCKAGRRSAAVAQAWRNVGIDAVNLAEGYSQWQ